MTASDVDQMMITEHSAHVDSHRNSSTTSDNDMGETVSLSVSQYRNSSTTEMSTTTTVAEQQRRASAVVNWSAWQAPVDSHQQRDDDTAYDYNNEDVENDEHLKTNTERQQFENNASGTEGRPVYVVRL